MMIPSQRIVVLGGGYAGMIAAARLARREPQASITLVDARTAFVQRIRMHELLAGRSPRTLDYAPALGRRSVQFVQGRAQGIDPQRQQITLHAADGATTHLDYDHLLVTLGSHTSAPVAGVAEHAIRLNDPAAITLAARQVREQAARGGHVLVVGGGLTGIETATELAERYPNLHFTLASGGAFGPQYSDAGRATLLRRFADLGITLRQHTPITALEAGRAWGADGTAIPFDLCVWCGGFTAPAMLRDSGLPVDGQGRVFTDAEGRVHGHANIWAAGDAAITPHALRMGCVTAMPLGAHAAANIGRELHHEAGQPFRFGFLIRCISLGRQAALVQFTHADDAPRQRIWTRRPAVWTKEAICRMTFSVIQNELRWGVPLFVWSQPQPTPTPVDAV